MYSGDGTLPPQAVNRMVFDSLKELRRDDRGRYSETLLGGQQALAVRPENRFAQRRCLCAMPLQWSPGRRSHHCRRILRQWLTLWLRRSLFTSRDNPRVPATVARHRRQWRMAPSPGH